MVGLIVLNHMVQSKQITLKTNTRFSGDMLVLRGVVRNPLEFFGGEDTLPKTNTEPKHAGLEDDFPFQRDDFQEFSGVKIPPTVGQGIVGCTPIPTYPYGKSLYKPYISL